MKALLASVMPSESDILFTETWASDGAGGWDGELDMQIPGQPVSLSAEFTLAASGKGCVYAIEHEAQELESREISASELGERVMHHLRELDAVAYVRFASVYRSFRDIDEFLTELGKLVKAKGP